MSDNLRGALLMCASMFFFTLNDSLIKSATQTLPLFQAVAIRGTLVLAGLLVLARATSGGGRGPRTGRDRLWTGLRALAEVASTVLFLSALQHMALADLSALFQSVPLLVTLGAALVFGERIGWRRLTAIGIGFLGVLIIIRPGASVFDPAALLAMAAVVCTVIRDLATRGISPGVGSVTISVWTAGAVTAFGYVASVPQGWIMPDGMETTKIVLASAALVGGYVFSVATMRAGEVGFVAPFRYTSLIWAIALGWIGFGTLPDGVTLFGAGIVVASGLYAFWRERQLRRKAAR